MVMEIRDKNKIAQFMSQYADTRLKIELLLFWKRYPHAKFTSRMIAHALDCTGASVIEEALEPLVKDELIEKHTWQGLSFYCLPDDFKKRQGILNLLTVFT